MRLTLDLLGHHFDFSIDHPEEAEGDGYRESSLDSLVERADPHAPPIGFYPHPRYDIEETK